jgi:hypothetical protein
MYLYHQDVCVWKPYSCMESCSHLNNRTLSGLPPFPNFLLSCLSELGVQFQLRRGGIWVSDTGLGFKCALRISSIVEHHKQVEIDDKRTIVSLYWTMANNQNPDLNSYGEIHDVSFVLAWFQFWPKWRKPSVAKGVSLESFANKHVSPVSQEYGSRSKHLHSQDIGLVATHLIPIREGFV